MRREEARQGVGKEPPGATFPRHALAARVGWDGWVTQVINELGLLVMNVKPQEKNGGLISTS